MSNSYYNHSTYPTPNAPGSSAQLRAELDLITVGFGKLPTLTGNGYKVAMINAAGNAMVASSALQQLAITLSAIDSTPIGATTRAAGNFTNLSVNGTAGLGTSVTIGGGTINNTPIGGSTPSSGAFTTVSAASGFTGNLAGNVTGNLTGNVVGDVTGNLAGNVTTSTGTSTFNNVTITGTLNMDAGTVGTITGLSTPVNATDAATKGYVDTGLALKLNLSGGTMSGNLAMGSNLVTGLGTPTSGGDATSKTYVDTADALKLNLAGGTMSGAIAMGGNAITGLSAPSFGGDATNKTYVDTQRDTRLALAGGTMSGAIAMGTNKITGMGDPTSNQDAATKVYVDTQRDTRLPLAGGTMSGNIAMGTNRVTGLGDPVNPQDAATKAYVDATAQGLDVKGSVRAATTANITLSGTQTVDGVALIAGDRALVKDQVAPADNGVYVVAAGAWTRSADMDVWTEFPGSFFFVEEGTANDNSGWVCTVSQGGTLGSTAVTFEQFSGAGQITAGAGMTKTGNTLNVGTASSDRIVVNADNIDLAATGVAASTYRSVTVDVYGRVTAGTNPTTLAGYGITDAYTTTQVDTALGLKLNLAGGTMSGAIAMGSNAITGLPAPSATGDAARKGYVDDGLALKLSLAGGTMSGAIAMGANKITGMGDPTLAQDAATKSYTDTGLALKLSLSGGTMSGDVAMGTNRVTGLGAPVGANDAATKTYVDTADALKLSLSGGTMSGAIAMGANKITGLADPTLSQDAVTLNYVTTLYGSTASAAASASAAAASELAAANSATAASGSASAALTSANNAAASYDAFDDRYLGSKTSDPTVDNDGNPLLTGALYWNSSASVMKVYDGAAWNAAYIPAAGYLALSGGTMTGAITFAAGQTWPTFNQDTTGNAATATALQTARTINGVSFNGTANITVADSTKLPLAGGTMSGSITFAGGQTFPGTQDTLVSGTNIKTINGNSVLGSGDIVIAGGVTSFNTRTGAVTLTSGDVTSALTYTPATLAANTFTADQTINGLRAGRGAGAVAGNTALGATALNANTTGSNNTAIGNQALYSNTTGANNTAVGVNALLSNTSASTSTAVGSSAARLVTGAGATAVGHQALERLASGTNNTAVGLNALRGQGSPSPTFGYNNVAVGSSALVAITNGHENVALGNSAGSSLNIGYQNVVIGTSAGSSLGGGQNNTFIGHAAGQTASSSVSYSVGIGNQALSPITASYAVGIGDSAGKYAEADSVSIGTSAGRFAGVYSVYIGKYAGYDENNYLNSGSSGVIAIGYEAARYAKGTSPSMVAIAEGAAKYARANDSSIFVGYNAGHKMASGNYSIAIGYESQSANPTLSAYSTIFAGGGSFTDGFYPNVEVATITVPAPNNTAFFDVSVNSGLIDLVSVVSDPNNLFASNYGTPLLFDAETANGGAPPWGPGFAVWETTANPNGIGSDNISIGRGSLRSISTGCSNNIAIGPDALYSLSTSSYSNIAIGTNAGRYLTGPGSSNNIFIGLDAGLYCTNRSNCIIIGAYNGSFYSGFFIGDNEIVISDPQSGQPRWYIDTKGAVGYPISAGGSVSQTGSRTTAVTVNKPTGAITLFSAAGTTAWTSFTVNNNTVKSSDVVIVNQKSGTNVYQIFVTQVNNGSFIITFATTGGTATDAPVFNFALIKAQSS